MGVQFISQLIRTKIFALCAECLVLVNVFSSQMSDPLGFDMRCTVHPASKQRRMPVAKTLFF